MGIGGRKPKRSLTTAQWETIYRLVKSGRTQVELAARYGIEQGTISHYIRRREGRLSKSDRERNVTKQVDCVACGDMFSSKHGGIGAELCWKCNQKLCRDFPRSREGDLLRDVRKWAAKHKADDEQARREVQLLYGMFEYRELPIRRVTELPKDNLPLRVPGRKSQWPIDQYFAEIERLVLGEQSLEFLQRRRDQEARVVVSRPDRPRRRTRY